KVEEIIKDCKPLWDKYREKLAARKKRNKEGAESLNVTKARELVAHVRKSEGGKTVPSSTNKEVLFSDNTYMGSWWHGTATKINGCIANDPKVEEIIKDCKPLWDKYREKLAARNKKRDEEGRGTGEGGEGEGGRRDKRGEYNEMDVAAAFDAEEDSDGD
ncbi:hypothetical protein TrCOL_g3620, partial [Triparma columacea]